MEHELTYEEKVRRSSEYWDRFSFAYFTNMNRATMGLMSTLMALTRVYKKFNILDAGCGPGLGTRQISNGIPNIGSNIYAIDFSPEMINHAEKVFSDYADFNANANNHWEVCKLESGSKIVIENDLKEIRKIKIGKVIKFSTGNAENLNFADEQFDAYISNLCIMLCVDADKAINEAYRVLKKDGVAAFSIWGKKENSYLWSLTTEVLLKFGIDTSGERSNFYLSKNQDELKERFIKAGFKDIRYEYTSAIFDCFDEQEFLNKFLTDRLNGILKSLNDEQKSQEIIDAIKNEAKKQTIDNKQMVTLNSLIIVGFK